MAVHASDDSPAMRATDENLLVAVPAYYACEGSVLVPFIVSLLFINEQGKMSLVPAVQASINRTVDITGRSGLATTVIADSANLRDLVRKRFTQASVLPDSILLFMCQSVPTAERLMMFMNDTFDLKMIKEM